MSIKKKITLYQSRTGAILIMLGTYPTELTLSQINELKIESIFYEIPDFDNIKYQEYYNKP